MKIRLVGVVQKTGTYAAGVPQDTRRPITLTKGDTLDVRLMVLNDDGTEVNTGGSTYTLSVRKNTGSTITLSATATGSSNSAFVDLAIPSASTVHLDSGEYLYDILEQTSGGVRNTIIKASRFTLTPLIFD